MSDHFRFSTQSNKTRVPKCTWGGFQEINDFVGQGNTFSLHRIICSCWGQCLSPLPSFSRIWHCGDMKKELILLFWPCLLIRWERTSGSEDNRWKHVVTAIASCLTFWNKNQSTCNYCMNPAGRSEATPVFHTRLPVVNIEITKCARTEGENMASSTDQSTIIRSSKRSMDFLPCL